MKKYLDELIDNQLKINKISQLEKNCFEYQLENKKTKKMIYIKWYYLIDKYFLCVKNDYLEIKYLTFIDYLYQLKKKELINA